MLEDKRIAVWFSCGAASAVAAKLTLDLYGGATGKPMKNFDFECGIFCEEKESADA